jgi:hypothetical protein
MVSHKYVSVLNTELIAATTAAGVEVSKKSYQFSSMARRLEDHHPRAGSLST